MTVVFITALNWVNGRLPGSVGRMIRGNMSSEIDVGAYIYSDVAEIDVFLDNEGGKYGEKEVRGSLAEHYQHRSE